LRPVPTENSEQKLQRTVADRLQASEELIGTDQPTVTETQHQQIKVSGMTMADNQ